jgi:hypothetical protein
LAVSPWKQKEERQLQLLEEDRPAEAFQARDAAPELRVGTDRAMHLVGVARMLDREVAPASLPRLTEAGGRERIVDPREAESRPGVYASLAAAVLDAKPGDVILVRSDGVLRVDPVQLNKKNLGNLTIRPYPRCHPVLVLTTTDKEAALFTVLDGTLRLENLELRLVPDKDGFTSQALVALAGDGECLLKGCLITLDKGGHDTALALAALPEAGKVMKSDGPAGRTHEQGPRLSLEGCFVRGDGDLIAGRSRPFELEAKNTLTALGGSLLNVDAKEEGPAAGAVPKAALLRLTQVTTYLGGSLLHLSVGKELKGVVPVRVEPSRCLFLPAPGAKPLVYLEGSEEKALARKLDWQGGVNGYGSYTSLLEQQPPGEAMMLPPVNRESWKTNYGESGSKFNLEPAAPPAVDEPFTQLAPAQFKLPDNVTGCGADPATLPRPAPRGTDAPRARPASTDADGEP